MKNPLSWGAGLRPHPPADRGVYFIEQAIDEANRYVTKAMTAAYLDILVEKGYLLRKGPKFRATRKFGDLVVEASEMIRERGLPLKPEDDPREAFGWEMALIVLQLDSSRRLEDAVNPREFGGLANIITGVLKSFSISAEILREALEAED
jgi:hypothetical protein